MTPLLNSAKQNRRYFWPIWIFPFWFLFGGVALEHSSHPFLIFGLIFIPLFFWSFFRATRPWMRREIKYSHYAFWVMVVPFLTWIVLVYLRIFFVG
jgi:hypothetical protein